MTLADKIQTLRKENNLSQEQLADKLDISRQAVSKWESEQALPDIDKIIALSDLFGVTTDFLLKDTEQRGKSKQIPFHMPPIMSKFAIKIVTLIATLISICALIVTVAVWFTWKTPIAFVAFILQVGAFGFFEMAKNAVSVQYPVHPKAFYIINIPLCLAMVIFAVIVLV